MRKFGHGPAIGPECFKNHIGIDENAEFIHRGAVLDVERCRKLVFGKEIAQVAQFAINDFGRFAR